MSPSRFAPPNIAPGRRDPPLQSSNNFSSLVSVVQIRILHTHAASGQAELRVARAAIGRILLETGTAGWGLRSLAAHEGHGSRGNEEQTEDADHVVILSAPSGAFTVFPLRRSPYFTMQRKALTPSFQLIFFPSAQVRPK
jgi:hypothetical protein